MSYVMYRRSLCRGYFKFKCGVSLHSIIYISSICIQQFTRNYNNQPLAKQGDKIEIIANICLLVFMCEAKLRYFFIVCFKECLLHRFYYKINNK